MLKCFRVRLTSSLSARTELAPVGAPRWVQTQLGSARGKPTSDTGYTRRSSEGKKSLAFLIVLRKKRRFSVCGKPQQTTPGHRVLRRQDDPISFADTCFFLNGLQGNPPGFSSTDGLLGMEPPPPNQTASGTPQPRKGFMSEARLAPASR